MRGSLLLGRLNALLVGNSAGGLAGGLAGRLTLTASGILPAPDAGLLDINDVLHKYSSAEIIIVLYRIYFIIHRIEAEFKSFDKFILYARQKKTLSAAKVFDNSRYRSGKHAHENVEKYACIEREFSRQQ